MDPSVFEDAWTKNLEEYEKLRGNDQDFEKMLEDQYKKILEEMEKGEYVDCLMAKAWQGVLIQNNFRPVIYRNSHSIRTAAMSIGLQKIILSC
jgi:hypothetical protein